MKTNYKTNTFKDNRALAIKVLKGLCSLLYSLETKFKKIRKTPKNYKSSKFFCDECVSFLFAVMSFETIRDIKQITKNIVRSIPFLNRFPNINHRLVQARFRTGSNCRESKTITAWLII